MTRFTKTAIVVLHASAALMMSAPAQAQISSNCVMKAGQSGQPDITTCTYVMSRNGMDDPNFMSVLSSITTNDKLQLGVYAHHIPARCCVDCQCASAGTSQRTWSGLTRT
jgi:hypothetical protein